MFHKKKGSQRDEVRVFADTVPIQLNECINVFRLQNFVLIINGILLRR